ncbi:hypothetical protein [Aeromonas veronii]|uniref:hypothetical protein n=1 Tax=Aeromonas veronii TaxID=654 RepID=UPI0035B9CB6B
MGTLHICGGKPAAHSSRQGVPPLLSSTEQRYCPSCQRETNHVVVLVDKSFGKQPKPEQKRTAFIKDFITGWAAGPFLANMDRFERHVICENCGNKVID